MTRRQKKWSERQDSNLRHPAPKAGALARLSYAPTAEEHEYRHKLAGAQCLFAFFLNKRFVVDIL